MKIKKDLQQHKQRSDKHPSTGPQGISILPPAYGMESVDRALPKGRQDGVAQPIPEVNPAPGKGHPFPAQVKLINTIRNSPLQRSWETPRESTSSEAAPVQMLMNRATFLEQRQEVVAQNVLLGTIGDHLHTFTGLTNENDADYQTRLQTLKALDTAIHTWLTNFVQYKIDDVPNGALMRTLLNESAAAHQEIVTAIAANDQLLPIDTTGLNNEAKIAILTLWRSIVNGTGNLRIVERENKPGFRQRMLAAIAHIIQGPGGRAMIRQLNEGGEEEAQRITLSSSFTDELEGTQKAEAQKNEAIPLNSLNNNNKAYELQYVAPQQAQNIQLDQIRDYDGNVNDMGEFTRFLMASDRPYVRYRNSLYLLGQGTGSYVRIHSQGSSTLSGENDQEIFTPEFVTVAHELGHANRMRKGAVISSTMGLDEFGVAHGPDENLWTNSEEFVNIKGTENVIRNEHGISRRKYHAGNTSNVRNVKNHWVLDQRVSAALPAALQLDEARIATIFPDYEKWQNMPFNQPAPDFSDPNVVNQWIPVVQNIEAFGPTYVALARENLIPELMYERARPLLQTVMNEDDEFGSLRLQFNKLMSANEGVLFATRARALGEVAKGRMISLDFQAARRSALLFEDIDFTF